MSVDSDLLLRFIRNLEMRNIAGFGIIVWSAWLFGIFNVSRFNFPTKRSSNIQWSMSHEIFIVDL